EKGGQISDRAGAVPSRAWPRHHPPSATPTTAATDPASSADHTGGSLPVTGRTSLPIGLIASILFSLGLGLLRTARRRSL
ncbi:MAG: hypothetical protein ABMA25_18525, partial [Ilumatobacteraceae bacterium]